MTRESRTLWNKLQKARRLELEKEELMRDIMSCLNKYEELNVDLHASNSDNLEETLSCFVEYGEDEEKLKRFFEKR